MSGVRVVLVTGPDPETLFELGGRLVDERLAACVNVMGDVDSVYRWEGRVETAGEALAIVKTTRDRLEALERRVRALHPYAEPEVVALDVTGGSRTYLDWIARSVEREG